MFLCKFQSTSAVYVRKKTCATLCPSSLYWDCHIKPRMDTKSVSGHYNTINRNGKCPGLPVVQSSIVVLDLSRDGSCLLFSDLLLVVFFFSLLLSFFLLLRLLLLLLLIILLCVIPLLIRSSSCLVLPILLPFPLHNPFILLLSFFLSVFMLLPPFLPSFLLNYYY